MVAFVTMLKICANLCDMANNYSSGGDLFLPKYVVYHVTRSMQQYIICHKGGVTMIQRNKNVWIAGIILSAVVGAIACSGPFLWVAMANPESENWGFDPGFTIFILVIGAIIGGACCFVSASMGGVFGQVVNTENSEAVGVMVGILAGIVVGGLVAFVLAVLGMGILA